MRPYRLSDAPPRLVIVCGDCPHRRGEYSRDRAIAERGNITLPDFLAQVKSACPNHGDIAYLRPCQAHFAEESLVRNAPRDGLQMHC